MSCPGRGEGGGLLSSYRLMEMCHWMGSHFHNWIDHNEVAFPIELQSRAAYFRDLGA